MDGHSEQLKRQPISVDFYTGPRPLWMQRLAYSDCGCWVGWAGRMSNPVCCINCGRQYRLRLMDEQQGPR